MIKARDINIISDALKYAEKNKIKNRYTMVAYLADKKQILSKGVNDYKKTHPKTPQPETYNITTHAEIKCLAKWIGKNKKISDNYTLYIAGLSMAISENVPVNNSRCCDSCEKFIKSIGIKRVVYIKTNKNNVELNELNF